MRLATPTFVSQIISYLMLESPKKVAVELSVVDDSCKEKFILSTLVEIQLYFTSESSRYVFSPKLFIETASDVSIPVIAEVRSFKVEAMSGTSSFSMLDLVVWDAEAEMFMVVSVDDLDGCSSVR